jgi:hypothetical protein
MFDIHIEIVRVGEHIPGTEQRSRLIVSTVIDI